MTFCEIPRQCADQLVIGDDMWNSYLPKDLHQALLSCWSWNLSRKSLDFKLLICEVCSFSEVPMSGTNATVQDSPKRNCAEQVWDKLFLSILFYFHGQLKITPVPMGHINQGKQLLLTRCNVGHPAEIPGARTSKKLFENFFNGLKTTKCWSKGGMDIMSSCRTWFCMLSIISTWIVNDFIWFQDFPDPVWRSILIMPAPRHLMQTASSLQAFSGNLRGPGCPFSRGWRSSPWMQGATWSKSVTVRALLRSCHCAPWTDLQRGAHGWSPFLRSFSCFVLPSCSLVLIGAILAPG